jgi:hypothetical protein
MRLVCGLAIALGLSFPLVGQVSAQQDSPASATSTDQSPAKPAAKEDVPPKPLAAPSPAAVHKHPAKAAPRRRKPASTKTQPSDGPKKIVVREGGAREPAEQMAPDITPAEALRQRQNAEQWLGSVDDRLKQLASRRLDAPQQETVGQIRNYAQGARSALKEGDVRRASTLAEKAHLLAEDLIRH